MNWKVIIAKYKLGLVSIIDFPKFALEIIISGIESDDLLILAGMNEKDNVWELEHYVKKVNHDFSIKEYSKFESAYILAMYYFEKVANEDIGIIEGLQGIFYECIFVLEEENPGQKYKYDQIGFAEIYRVWDQYEEMDQYSYFVKNSTKSLEEIQLEIQVELKELLNKWGHTFLKVKLSELNLI